MEQSNMKKIQLLNERLAIPYKNGIYGLRVWWTNYRGKRDGHWTVRCGDCSADSLTIYPNNGDDTVEINGVIGHIEQWIELMRSRNKEC